MTDARFAPHLRRHRATPSDPDWPAALDALDAPPRSLTWVGDPPSLERAVAIVGTRNADPEACDFAHALARDLAREGCTVVSGGALGVDAAAHRGAMAGGGPTVAVLASGLEHPYPPAHRALFESFVAARGALMSEHPEDVPPHPGRFLERNRIVAALARLVVVVQAPRRSGALSTAAHARALQKPVLVVPAAPWDLRGEGGLDLLRSGATVCTSVRDVLRIAAFGGPRTPERTVDHDPISNDVEGLDADGRLLLSALGSRPRAVDALCRQVGLEVARVQRALLLLLLAGHAEERGPGRYVRARPPPRP